MEVEKKMQKVWWECVVPAFSRPLHDR